MHACMPPAGSAEEAFTNFEQLKLSETSGVGRSAN